jgi:DNA-binding response OmpR family regulator
MAKILVAEDERDIRDLITFTLNYAGHQVFAVANGEEAIEVAMREMPDMILMDVRMPKMTGYEACQKIKANTQIQHIPIVFLSAKGQEAEIRTGLDVGATEYLLKPFAPMELTVRVNELLKQYKK